MKKLVLVAVFLLGFSVMAVAQDVPVVEVFGGYSLVLVDTATAAEDSPGAGMDLNLNGWNASIAFNANKWAGFVVDLGGYYGTIGEDYEFPREDAIDPASVRIHSLMIGPKITLHRGVVTPFVQALIGVAHLTAKVDDEMVQRENDFAIALGGGIDVNLSSQIALRPVQLEWFMHKSAINGHFADNMRYSAGVVFKIGKK